MTDDSDTGGHEMSAPGSNGTRREDTPGSGTEGGSAFTFTGDWREFAPIAFTNLLLTIVTLGIYSFWARTRERQYLWSRTTFIDDPLEWTGKGLELFIGYILAVIVFGLPLVVLQLVAQGLVMQDQTGAAGILVLVLYFLLLYLVGVAIFRALRYRLSRTYWRGIRGGSDDNGFGFGLSYVWRTIAGSLALGLMVPWAMTTLWNERWNKMSFGPLRFESAAEYGAIFARYLLFYLVPVLLFALGAFVAMAGGALVGAMDGPADPRNPPMGIIVGVLVVYFGFFIILGIIALVYYSAYFREVVGKLSLGDLDFSFTASTWDWIKLFIGNTLLVVLTLGIGQIFVGYRNWSFFIRHMEAYGTIDVDALTQSQTREPGQGEGLLDAFDVGAI